MFDPGVLVQLSLITLGRIAGFPLDEIKRMFGPDGRPTMDRGQLSAKADELDRTVKHLSTLRDGLRHAGVCPASTIWSARHCSGCSTWPLPAAAGLRGGDPSQHLLGTDDRTFVAGM
ncbi:MerR family DNA-binding protein [Microvirga pakistanensis]|uniref:MerR family DNA-binding protein n=1 Tax=Microvirga pakistanensis TaxID=1682650 RepID=UPI00313BC875